MNNRDTVDLIRDTPERERLKRDILDQLTAISNDSTVESPWIIDVTANNQRLSVVVNRKGSTAKNAVFSLLIQLQPHFPIRLLKKRIAFFDQRVAKLEDALALIKTLVNQ